MVDLDKPLCLSRRLIQPPGGEPHSVSHATLQTMVELNEEGWKLLEHFRRPTTPRQVLSAAGVPAEEVEAFQEVVADLVGVGVLTPPAEEEYLYEHGLALFEAQQPLLAPVPMGLLGARTEQVEADFRIVGVPFDKAASRPGPARAPEALRRLASGLLAYTEPLTGRHRGLWDHSEGRLLLEGALLQDHGDIAFPPWEEPAQAGERMAAAAAQLRERGGLPVFLGGDHSITEPLVRGLGLEEVFIVHFDAHTDLAPLFRQVPHHHGSFMERLRRLEAVQGVLQVGVRDIAPPWWQPVAKVTQLGARRMRSMATSEVLALIPPKVPIYITLDIDAVDPAEAPGTGTPVPGGLSFLQVEELLEAIGLEREVVGFDLVEVAPELDPRAQTQLGALRLLVRLLDAIHRRTGARRSAKGGRSRAGRRGTPARAPGSAPGSPGRAPRSSRPSPGAGRSGARRGR